jgi:hypothetical protein
MQALIAAAISTRSLMNKPQAAILNMETWLQLATEECAELVSFPILDLSGYIPIARHRGRIRLDSQKV